MNPTRAAGRVLRAARYAYYATQVNMACSRGALDLATRRFDHGIPHTWEFSAFSQNGEDGVIDYLLSLVRSPNRYFVEIGASHGLENNSAFLTYVKRYGGIMVEGDPRVSRKAKEFVEVVNPGVRCLNMMVTPINAHELVRSCRHTDPDFYSLDIDGYDLPVAQACLGAGLRPKVVCVEYNSALGPDRAIAVPFPSGRESLSADPRGLYYGASVMAWRMLFEPLGYHFVSVESRGVNAFFVDTAAVDQERLKTVKRLEFAENLGQLDRFSGGWRQQFDVVAGMPFVAVGSGGPSSTGSDTRA